MLVPDLVTTDAQLKQILDLQQANLIRNISDEEFRSQGFVTMEHSFDVLKQMHALAPSIIVRDDDNVVGYALVMLKECRSIFPPLEPMFASFDKLKWNGKALDNYEFYAMGQICIDKKYRGLGVFDLLYNHHKETYKNSFDLILTEVSTRNHRSLRAHERVGFITIDKYRDSLDEWAVVLWDWS